MLEGNIWLYVIWYWLNLIAVVVSRVLSIKFEFEAVEISMMKI